MSQYDTETNVTPTAEGRFEGLITPDWNIGENPNGGYLISVVLSALQKVAPHSDPISITAHYLRPGSANTPCEVNVQLIRAGKTLSTLRATLLQEGKERLEVIAAFSELDESVGVSSGITMPEPDLPSPNSCIQRAGDSQGIILPIESRLDVRLHPEQAEPGKYGLPVMSGWIRFADGREPDVKSLVLFADAFPPSTFGQLGRVGWVPTIELTVHVRRKPAPGWIKARFETDDLSNGRMIETGALWDSEGNLVAQSRQIGLVLQGG